MPPETWEQDGVVPAEPVGSGPQALKSLAPDIFRVALSTQRLLKREDGRVTFPSTDANTDTLHTQILPVEALIRRFVRHVLPPRFITVRDDGCLASRNRHRLAQLTDLLDVKPVATPPPPHAPAAVPDRPQAERRCPQCGSTMQRVGDLAPTRRRPFGFGLQGARASP